MKVRGILRDRSVKPRYTGTEAESGTRSTASVAIPACEWYRRRQWAEQRSGAGGDDQTGSKTLAPKEESKLTRKTAAEHHAAEDGAQAPSLLASAALIGIGALIEPELLAGMAIGAGVVLISRWFPNIVGDLVRPIARTAVKAGYAAAAATREVVAEVTEEVEDLMAEASAEHESAEHPH